jgi:hypothetical protein
MPNDAKVGEEFEFVVKARLTRIEEDRIDITAYSDAEPQSIQGEMMFSLTASRVALADSFVHNSA